MAVRFRSCATVNIERYAEIFEAFLDQRMIPIHHILRRNSLFTSTYRDGHTMFIGAADEDHILLFQPEITHVNIGRHIYAGKMPYMYAAIGIRQCRGYGGSLKVLLFHCSTYKLILNAKLQLFINKHPARAKHITSRRS